MEYKLYNKSKGRTALSVNCDDGRAEISTGVKKLDIELHPEAGYLSSEKEAIEANEKIKEFIKKVEAAYNEVERMLNVVTKADLLSTVRGGKTKNGTFTIGSVFEFFEEYINTEEGQLDPKGEKLSPASIRNRHSSSRVFNLMSDIFKSTNLAMFSQVPTTIFAKKKLERMMLKLGLDFTKELREKGYSDVSIRNYVAQFRLALRKYSDHKSMVIDEYTKFIKYRSLQRDVEIMTVEQIEYLLENYDQIRDNCKGILKDHLDYWIAGILTSARVTDMKNWSSENIVNKDSGMYLTYVQSKSKKSGKKLTIPVHPLLQKIFRRNMINYWRPLPEIKSQCSNMIPRIAKDLPPFQGTITRVQWYDGKRIEKEIPEWKAMNIHKARASCASYMLGKGVPEKVVKSFTGHTANSSSFSRYVETDMVEKEEAINKVFSIKTGT
jgi:integrase